MIFVFALVVLFAVQLPCLLVTSTLSGISVLLPCMLINVIMDFTSDSSCTCPPKPHPSDSFCVALRRKKSHLSHFSLVMWTEPKCVCLVFFPQTWFKIHINPVSVGFTLHTTDACFYVRPNRVQGRNVPCWIKTERYLSHSVSRVS